MQIKYKLKFDNKIEKEVKCLIYNKKANWILQTGVSRCFHIIAH